MKRYPLEVLSEDYDNGTMPDNVAELEAAVVGHRITNTIMQGGSLLLVLDNGRVVVLEDSDDCCAYTQVHNFLMYPDRVDHVITGVGTTDGYTRWHIYADLGDVLSLTVDWSAGNPFYYGYGFHIHVSPHPVSDRSPKET